MLAHNGGRPSNIVTFRMWQHRMPKPHRLMRLQIPAAEGDEAVDIADQLPKNLLPITVLGPHAKGEGGAAMPDGEGAISHKPCATNGIPARWWFSPLEFMSHSRRWTVLRWHTQGASNHWQRRRSLARHRHSPRDRNPRQHQCDTKCDRERVSIRSHQDRPYNGKPPSIASGNVSAQFSKPSISRAKVIWHGISLYKFAGTKNTIATVARGLCQSSRASPRR